MQTQHAATLTEDALTGGPPIRPDLRVVQINQSRRMFRALAVAAAALVATGGYVHLCLYRHGYRMIPTIGVGFGLQVVTSAVIVAALLIGPHRVARVARVTDRLAGTLAAFTLTRTPGGLFNFQERGLQPAPQALIALVAEIGVLVVVGAWLVADHVVQRQVRTVSMARR
jgi:hypothetical protein